MPGKRLTVQQVDLYMDYRKKGKCQTVAAAKAGLSERSGRRIEKEKASVQKGKVVREWRTRKDPLAAVWDSELKPMLEAEPLLTADGLWEYLADNHPGQYGRKIRRTLQRRVKAWKACHGKDKEVMFRQNHLPGRLGISDFTKLKRATITIDGKAFDHLLFHYRLPYSGWRYVKVILGGESFEALSSGLQGALERSGGVPQEHRTDGLSAAYRNKTEKETLTKRYEGLCKHYQMIASRNNPGQSHENGAIESPHGHFKRKLEQALLIRDSTDFTTVNDYQSFIDDIIQKLNSRCADIFRVEQKHLQPLPDYRSPDYDEIRTVVSSSSTVEIKRVTYSVPSRLVGERVCVHVFDERIDIYVGATLAYTNARVRAQGGQRARCIDYTHLISSLVKKPQAFRYSQLREDLIPNEDYRLIWAYVDKTLEPRKACRYFVRLLHLASRETCEGALGRFVIHKIQQEGRLPTEDECRKRFANSQVKAPNVHVVQHDLKDYDQLIGNFGGDATCLM